MFFGFLSVSLPLPPAPSPPCEDAWVCQPVIALKKRTQASKGTATRKRSRLSPTRRTSLRRLMPKSVGKRYVQNRTEILQ